MFWIIGGLAVVIVVWLAGKSQQGRSEAMGAIVDGEAEARAAALVAEVRAKKARDQGAEAP